MRNKLNNWYVASVEAPSIRHLTHLSHAYYGWRPCIEWCEQTFGDMRSPDHPNRWRFVSEGVFEFREQSDLTAFLLRWG
jgi:hypothetical protein